MIIRRKKLLLAIMILSIGLFGCSSKEEAISATEQPDSMTVESTEEVPEKLTIWYTQPDLESYITEVADSYQKDTGVSIEAVLVPALDYIETVNQVTIADQEFPDLYVTTSDMLEKVKLLGLAMPANEQICSKENFTDKALQAVTYRNQKIAYPFYADTSVLIYNDNYTQEAPKNIDDILAFAENFEGDGQIQKIFMWNVNDIFIDFFSIGAYVNLGGACGDDINHLMLNNEQILESLSYYQVLNQFFAIEREEAGEEQIIQDFSEGKIVYAIVRDDAIQKLSESEVSFTVCDVPDLTADLCVRPLSITHSIVVNGYTKYPQHASEFAKYLTVDKVDLMYGINGNISVNKNLTVEDPKIEAVRTQYDEAVEVPKIMQLSNYWLQMEQVFAKVWEGADPEETMTEAENEIRSAMYK